MELMSFPHKFTLKNGAICETTTKKDITRQMILFVYNRNWFKILVILKSHLKKKEE